MHNLLLLLSRIQKNRVKIITIAVVAVFAGLIIIFTVETNKLNQDIEKYESEITYLNEKHTEYQTALEVHEELVKEIEQLETSNDSLEVEVATLAEENIELERQNGELSKKFDGLSKPQ